MFDWSDEKDHLLRNERGIGFQEIIFHIGKGDALSIADHPNQAKYPGQKIIFVNAGGYVYMVPFVESDGVFFLKTIIPSRKAIKKYLEENQ